MFERKEIKKPGNGRTKKGRRQLEWEHAQRKWQERESGNGRKENRRRQLRFEDDVDMDWRDLLMEEHDDELNRP